MSPGLVKRFTEFGDPTLLLLAALAMFFYLWIDNDRRQMAGAWAQSVGLCIGLIFVSKLVQSCVHGRPQTTVDRAGRIRHRCGELYSVFRLFFKTDQPFLFAITIDEFLRQHRAQPAFQRSAAHIET